MYRYKVFIQFTELNCVSVYNMYLFGLLNKTVVLMYITKGYSYFSRSQSDSLLIVSTTLGVENIANNTFCKYCKGVKQTKLDKTLKNIRNNNTR